MVRPGLRSEPLNGEKECILAWLVGLSVPCVGLSAEDTGLTGKPAGPGEGELESLLNGIWRTFDAPAKSIFTYGQRGWEVLSREQRRSIAYHRIQ